MLNFAPPKHDKTIRFLMAFPAVIGLIKFHFIFLNMKRIFSQGSKFERKLAGNLHLLSVVFRYE